MPRRRMIDPEFWNDVEIGECSPIARLLFVAMFSNADDEGRLLADVKHLKRLAFGFDSTQPDQIAEALRELIGACQHLRYYESEGKRYVAFLKWGEYQHVQRPSKSRLPLPPGWVWEYDAKDSSRAHGAYTTTGADPNHSQPDTVPASDNGGNVTGALSESSVTLPVAFPEPSVTPPPEEKLVEEKRREERIRSGNEISAPASPEKVKPLRPGVDLFREVFGRYPSKEFNARFEAALASVGESLMRDRLQQWRDNPRCSPTNYADMVRVVTDGWRGDKGGTGAAKPKPWERAL